MCCQSNLNKIESKRFLYFLSVGKNREKPCSFSHNMLNLHLENCFNRILFSITIECECRVAYININMSKITTNAEDFKMNYFPDVIASPRVKGLQGIF